MMAMTVSVHITIVFADTTNQAKPQTHELSNFQFIAVQELPHNGTPAWMLSVSECICRQEAHWETLLSIGESQNLINILEKVPNYSLSMDEISCDGREYEVLIKSSESSRSFRWKNVDWQNAPKNLRGIWAQVAAIADCVMRVVERTRPV